MPVLLFKGLPDTVEDWRGELNRHVPDLEMRVWPDIGDPAEIDIVLGYGLPSGAIAALPNLKAVLYLGAGVDTLFSDPGLPPGLPMARMVDPKLTELMTGYVLYAVLRYHRGFDALAERQRERRWEYWRNKPNALCRVGVMGLGVLGSDVARTLSGMNFTVAGWSRTPKRIDGVETYAGPDQLATFLGRSDILCCLLPLTPRTRGIINAETLARLPRGARLVNPARGGLVVEADLLAALRSGHIGGATLDVFETEPLPPDNPLWTEPNVMVTPHMASGTEPESAVSVVAENISRAMRGEPLLNQVTVDKGY